MRGKLVKGSALDLDSAARSVIQDWTSGRFRYFVMPPAHNEGPRSAEEAETADVVTTLAPALDIDALFEDDDAMGGAAAKPVVLGAPMQGDSDDDSMECENGGGMVEVDM